MYVTSEALAHVREQISWFEEVEWEMTIYWYSGSSPNIENYLAFVSETRPEAFDHRKQELISIDEDIQRFIDDLEAAIAPRQLKKVPLDRYGEGRPPEEFVHEISIIFEEPTQRFCVQTNRFLRTSSERPTDQYEETFRKIYLRSQEIPSHFHSFISNLNGRIWSVNNQIDENIFQYPHARTVLAHRRV